MKKPITERTHRRQEDAVTHEMVVTVLDDVQKAFERVHQVIDGKMMSLSIADQRRLAEKLLVLVMGMLPHRD